MEEDCFVREPKEKAGLRLREGSCWTLPHVPVKSMERKKGIWIHFGYYEGRQERGNNWKRGQGKERL